MKDPVRSGELWWSGIWRLFEREVFGRSSGEGQFNPYRDRDPLLDLTGAPSRRRENLAAYLRSLPDVPEVVVVAEAPGPWGCRFSGVPITSEAQLIDPLFPVQGVRTSVRGEPYGEYSARIFWRVMLPFFERFLVWNAVPFHPHRAGEPLMIRAPRVGELRDFAVVTQGVIAETGPKAVVALGRRAERQLAFLGERCTYVRHPSQGGARAFEEGMRGVLGV